MKSTSTPYPTYVHSSQFAGEVGRVSSVGNIGDLGIIWAPIIAAIISVGGGLLTVWLARPKGPSLEEQAAIQRALEEQKRQEEKQKQKMIAAGVGVIGLIVIVGFAMSRR